MVFTRAALKFIFLTGMLTCIGLLVFSKPITNADHGWMVVLLIIVGACFIAAVTALGLNSAFKTTQSHDERAAQKTERERIERAKIRVDKGGFLGDPYGKAAEYRENRRKELEREQQI